MSKVPQTFPSARRQMPQNAHQTPKASAISPTLATTNYTRNSAGAIKRFKHRAAAYAELSPITIRSILLLLFCGYLLVGPVPQSADIIAASLAYGLLALFSVIALSALFQALHTKRSLAITLHPPEEPLVAGSISRCLLKLSRLRLLPGMLLECRILCANTGLAIPTIKLFTGVPADQRISCDVTPPHRGNWDIHGVRCIVGDLTGFIRLTWKIPFESSLVVEPAPYPDSMLPLVSSTQRAGDLVTDAVHRLGDPFDIKPYHPADGVKKIVWKAFAKSGQLLSRHAEASMTPEGFVALFVLARPEDDEVCGKALTYVGALSELKLDTLLSCEGQNGRPPGHSPGTSRQLLIDSTWDAGESNSTSVCDDLQALLDACIRTGLGVNVRKIVIFCSGARMGSTYGVDIMRSLASWMEERQITPVFFLTQPRITQDEQISWWSRLSTRILYEPNKTPQSRPSAAEYQQFLSTCLAKQWEVFI